ncbi:hypothetical protein TNCV_4044151 [Trichonephila clavipes]|nr:hypothetical protein TNCV_4044151 [Trichonephila clavipes]
MVMRKITFHLRAEPRKKFEVGHDPGLVAGGLRVRPLVTLKIHRARRSTMMYVKSIVDQSPHDVMVGLLEEWDASSSVALVTWP